MAEALAEPRVGKALDAKLRRIDQLVGVLESCPDPRLRDSARELLGTLMELHATALDRVLELLSQEPDWEATASCLGKDPVVGSVLLLHGLHPADVTSRVNDALEQVRPALQSHRGNVELLAIDENTVRLRLIGTCNGCPSSTTTFRNLIENAIYEMAPEIENIEVEGLA